MSRNDKVRGRFPFADDTKDCENCEHSRWVGKFLLRCDDCDDWTQPQNHCHKWEQKVG